MTNDPAALRSLTANLADDLGWRAWNRARASTRPPSGESMWELQLRILDHLETTHAARPDGRIVLVTHAEPIRAALLHCLGLSPDDFACIEIAPSSISTIDIDRNGPTVIAMNHMVAS